MSFFGYRTRAGDFTPIEIDSLEAWNDVTHEPSRTLFASKLGRLEDRSKNNNFWEQTTDVNRPDFLASGMNGLGTAEFTGTPESMTVNDDTISAITTAAEMFIIFERDVDPPADNPTSGTWYFSNSGGNTHVPWTTSEVQDGFGSTTRHNTGYTVVEDLTVPTCYNVSSASAEWLGFINGKEFVNIGTNTVGFDTNPLVGTKAGTYFLGRVGEFLLFNEKLSLINKLKVQNYLTRWGITFV